MSFDPSKQQEVIGIDNLSNCNDLARNPQSTTIKILLVEDNLGDVRLVREMLVEAGMNKFNLLHVERLSEALQHLNKDNLDVVLLDLSLPDGHGLNTVTKVHSAAPNVPLVVFTGFDDEALAVQAVREGAQDYLVKGQMDGNLLVRAIRHAIERHQLLADLEQRTQELQVREANFWNVIATNVDGMLIVDKHGVVNFVNPATEALFGCKAEKLLGELFGFPIVPGETREFCIIGEGRESAVVEMRVTETTWEGDSAYLASIRDITERKRAEEALRLNERAMAATSNGIIITDASQPQNPIIYFNPAFERLTGYSRDEILGYNCRFLQGPDTDPAVVEQIRHALREERECRVILKNYRKDGTPFWNELAISPVQDTSGQLTHFIGVQTDITERKQTEEALLRANLAEAAKQALEKEITERKRVEEALRESERRLREQNKVLVELARSKTRNLGELNTALREITEAATFALEIERASVWLYNDDHSEIHCIDLYERSTGRHSEGLALAAADYPTYFQALEKERTIAAYDAHTDPRTKEFSELYLSTLGVTSMLDAPIRLGGQMVGIVCHEHVGPMRQWALDEQNFAGSIADLVSLAMEIWERKRAEEALRESQRRLSSLINSLPGMVFSCANDLEYSMKYLSEGCLTLTGYTSEELLGNGRDCYKSTIHAEDLAKVFKAIETAIAEQRPYVVEYRIHTKSGQEKWLWEKGNGVFGENNEVLGAEGFITDITDRKRAEEEQQKLVYLVENSSDFICVATLEGQVIFVNDAGQKLVGLEGIEEVRRTAISNYFTAKDLVNFQEQILPVVMEQGHWEGEFRFKHFKTEALIPVHYNFFAIKDRQTGQPIAVATVSRDITERKRVEKELCNALEKEKELSELKSRFISMTSHEFRTPLAAILSSADLVQKYSHKLTEEQKLQYLQRIKTTVKNMSQLLNDVLLIGKAEAGKLEFNPQPLALAQFCRDLVEEMQLTAGSQYAIAFVKQGQCTTAWIEEKLLRHILSNLLSNAIKYSPQGGTVRFDLICYQGEAVFQIQDEGIGIPVADQAKLFDSFHRASNVGTISGTGLGLAIVKKSVESHGAKIAVNSEVGVGTTFTVTIPLTNGGSIDD